MSEGVNVGKVSTVFLYTLEDPRSPGMVRYIGKTSSPVRRLRSHVSVCSSPSPSHKNSWISGLIASGVTPKMEILEEVPEDEWEEAEVFYIKYLGFLGCDLTNVAVGGRGCSQHTDEVKRKISETKKSYFKHPESRTVASLARKAAWARLSESQKEDWKLLQKSALESPMVRERMSLGCKRKFESAHQRLAVSLGMKKFSASLTEEQKQDRRDRIREAMADPIIRAKISQNRRKNKHHE